MIVLSRCRYIIPRFRRSPLSRSLPEESERYLLILGGEVGGAEGFGRGEFGMEGCGRNLEAINDEDVPLVDGVLDGALSAFGERGCCFGDGVLASSCVRSMNNLLGGIIMIFGFLEALEVEVYEDAMDVFEVEDE
ncbi:hypothetical protein Tco_1525766 [Tanacetum coccineum]